MKRLLPFLVLALCVSCESVALSPPRLVVIDITRGLKVVNMGFDRGDFWYTTRSARVNETPEDCVVRLVSASGASGPLLLEYTLHETALSKPLPIWRPGERP